MEAFVWFWDGIQLDSLVKRPEADADYRENQARGSRSRRLRNLLWGIGVSQRILSREGPQRT